MEVLIQPHLQLSDSKDAQTTAILIQKLDKELEISNSEKMIMQCKSPTPEEKTEKKEKILVPKNESMKRSKVLKSLAKVNLECKTLI
uniref:Uncharacterized protein n=1 Tax=Cucumis sativus TaxID=3659 RepID=A0A0A0L848_CUCSA